MKKVSLREFNILTGIVMLWGIVLASVTAMFGGDYFSKWNVWLFMLAFLAVFIVGLAVMNRSDEPLISFLGYSLATAAVGSLLGVALKGAEVCIEHTLAIIAIAILVMIVVVAFIPEILLVKERAITLALLAAAAAVVLAWIFKLGTFSWWDAIIAAGLTVCIGYVWAKGQRRQRTIDQAVDSGAGLYLGVLKLFLKAVGAEG